MLNQTQLNRFCKVRQEVIAGEFQHLNPEQLEGVLTTEGPLLLLAGAGSGKTTVLINRIANLMKYGCGSDSVEAPDWVEPADLSFLEQYLEAPSEEHRSKAEMLCRLRPAVPWSIIAITFTNKAAGELKKRLEAMLGPDANDIWAATFHSACVRILRRDIDRMGFAKSFTIYDTDDSLRVIKDILKARNIDDKVFPPRAILNQISKAKDKMLLADAFYKQSKAAKDLRLTKIADVYQDYERRLKEADALDFDDIILDTVRLLMDYEEVRAYWQNKFHYVLIDEYQDTNHLQYLLASMLAGKWENICVVGDDDQSIYRFRGATIENIMDFEKQYKGARVIRLEQNYRSTKNILEASNAVIRNNQGRKGKELWTAKQGGELIKVYYAMNESDEAQYVAAQIMAGISAGRAWNDHAILYRMNAQSNQLEYALKRNGVPYKVVGGIKFFDRAEVKDMLAYLCIVNNASDNLRLRRIINTPTRGIGNKTIETAAELAEANGFPLYEVIQSAAQFPALQKSAAKLAVFVNIIEGLREKVMSMPLPDFYDEVIAATGYLNALEAKNTVENRTRIENVKELRSSIQGYVDNAPEPSLAGFLDEVALYTDLDGTDEQENAVTLMTMHSAKGLEFPCVFVVGVEEGIFPGIRCIGEPEEMEEERRLCYVALTRAKERLYVSCAHQRMLFGHTSSNRPSRFITEIPEEFVEKSGRMNPSAPKPEHMEGEDHPQRQNGYGGGYGNRTGYSGGGRYGGSSYSRQRKAPVDRGPLGGGISVNHTVATPQTSASILSEFKKGDRVEHTAFGSGMISAVTPMGGDALVEITFDSIGTKRLMLKAAAQHMKHIETDTEE